ncbi:UAA transporter [Macrolepiota fuliginosa MF-IS2]|uniref:UAA transporter n=1 Tax=Macrolepiota fuliginosa MF-IS2 TaxID=1400762 RepID=A0A9P6C4M4_9AGAR|nr:UAA transporter [Macrolepiota fuliginosa MF-IS2]
MVLPLIYDWSTTLGLVFGGCCSNAITLEQLTVHYPIAGSLITLFQFVLISLHGLPRHITWTRYGPRFKPRRIPITPYLVQVGLFYLISVLNNAAFGYKVPMSVHIIFRSGGLVVSMVLGWLISKKRYNPTQIISVLLVTLGVVLTTLSATPISSSNLQLDDKDISAYVTGIAILSLALILSGFLGLVQDWTYGNYGNSQTPSTELSEKSKSPPQWQESLFYLHFLSLPMFLFLRKDIQTQLRVILDSPRISWSASLPPRSILATYLESGQNTSSFISLSRTHRQSQTLTLSLHIPHAFTPLLLNTITQLICVSGVHRLTTRVSSLTVTLILVVRKAVSLLISVLGAGIIPGIGGGKAGAVDQKMMWSGATIVLLGTVLYSIGTGRKAVPTGGKEKGKGKKE